MCRMWGKDVEVVAVCYQSDKVRILEKRLGLSSVSGGVIQFLFSWLQRISSVSPHCLLNVLTVAGLTVATFISAGAHMFKLKPAIALTASLFFGFGLLSSGAVFAQGEEGERSRPGKPPQAAFDACASSSANAVCTVQTPKGDSMSGLCLNPPQQQDLVCVPDHHRQQRGGSQAGSMREPRALRE